MSKEAFEEHPVLGLWEWIRFPKSPAPAVAASLTLWLTLLLALLPNTQLLPHKLGALLFSPSASREGSGCLTLPFRWHCLVPAPSTEGRKAKAEPKFGPAGQRGHSPAAHVSSHRAQHPSLAAVSLSEVTQAQKGRPPRHPSPSIE